jgi:hypothetical protein
VSSTLVDTLFLEPAPVLAGNASEGRSAYEVEEDEAAEARLPPSGSTEGKSVQVAEATRLLK